MPYNTLYNQNSITTIILTTESINLEEAKKTVAGVRHYSNRILVGGTTDLGIEGATFIRLPDSKDRSHLKNTLLEGVEGWILIVEPGEQILEWKFDFSKKGVYTLPVIRNRIITKEIRLWHGSIPLRFTNPVFETIYYSKPTYLDIPILSKVSDYPPMEEITKWQKKNPSLADPYYYKSFILLSEKKYQDYLNTADHYLFLQKEGISAIMTNYYSAMVRFYQFEDGVKALQQVLQCLSCNPLMAEFWCLLGDIHFKSNKFDHARCFYENAILLGSQRQKSDAWPLEIPKYRKYPKKMIANCEKVIKETKVLMKT
jgi:tetratricopeptide (TPR) repeat protein